MSVSLLFFFSSRRRHTRWNCDWSSDVCSSDLVGLRLRQPADQKLHGLDCRERAQNLAQHPDAAQLVRRKEQFVLTRSEERRVGKECRSRRSAYHSKKKTSSTTVELYAVVDHDT